MRNGRPLQPELGSLDIHATSVVRGLALMDQDLAGFPDARHQLWAAIQGVSGAAMTALEAAANRERFPLQVRLREAASPRTA